MPNSRVSAAPFALIGDESLPAKVLANQKSGLSALLQGCTNNATEIGGRATQAETAESSIAAGHVAAGMLQGLANGMAKLLHCA